MLLKNFSSGVLSAAIGTGDTSISVNAGNTLPSTSGTFTAIIWNSLVYTSPSLDPSAEIILGAYSSPNVYTITRAQESTVATAHAIGATVGLYITAGVLTSLSFPYVKVSDTETTGTNGGSATVGSWQTRVLNTLDNDTASIASLGSNQVTLPAGTYRVSAYSTFNGVNSFVTRLQNITASTTLLTSPPGICGSSVNVIGVSAFTGLIVLSGTTTIALQYQVQTHTSTTDLGQPTSFQAEANEIYAVVDFLKIG